MEALAYADSPQTFFERVTRLLEKVDYRLALDDQDKEAIYRLRYDAYLREGDVPTLIDYDKHQQIIPPGSDMVLGQSDVPPLPDDISHRFAVAVG